MKITMVPAVPLLLRLFQGVENNTIIIHHHNNLTARRDGKQLPGSRVTFLVVNESDAPCSDMMYPAGMGAMQL